MSHSSKIRVLFMQSQSFFGADSVIHAALMRGYDRAQVEVHVACTSVDLDGAAVSAVKNLRAIPDLHFRPTDFGLSANGAKGSAMVRAVLGATLVAGNLLQLAAYVRRHRIQVIHCTEKPRDAFYGVLLGKMTGTKSVIHMHVNYGDWLNPGVKWALRNADAVVGVSQFTASSLVSAGVPPGRVFAVLNSLDLSDGRWAPRLEGDPGRRALGVPEGAPVIGITARLFRWKGHGDLIEALALIAAELPAVRLVIVGEDDPRADPGRGSYREELEARIRQLGLTENVLFTGFRTDIPALTAAFDVYAMPTWEEPFGMVFIEAMAMEKPVVAWANGGVQEIIRDGENGYLVPPKDIPALAAAILDLLKDPDRRRRFGQAGRRHVEEHFSSRRMCQDMVHVYRTVLGTPEESVRVASRDSSARIGA